MPARALQGRKRRMDLMLTDKVAVVTGAGKGIGMAVTRSSPTRARASSPGRARIRRPGGPGPRHGRRARPLDAGCARRAGATGARRPRPGRRPRQQRRRGEASTRRLPRHDRRRLRVGDEHELLHHAARHPRGAGADGGPRRRSRSSTSARSTPSSNPTAAPSTTAPPKPRCSTSRSRWRKSSAPTAST